MKKILLAVCIVCLLSIPAYSAIKDYSVLSKSLETIKLLRSASATAEMQIKSCENKLSDIIDLGAIQTDKIDIALLKTKITATLTALNNLISTIDTLYPEIK